MTIHSILCPVDLSPQSELVLRTAMTLAAREGAGVEVLHVVEPLLSQASAIAYEKSTLEDALMKDLDALVDDVTQHLGVPCEGVSIRIRCGEPHDAIVQAIDTGAPDLVVIGTQGFSGVRKLFFGSTAARVLARSTRPVLAIPPRGFSPHTHGKDDTPFGLERIVVGVDFSEASMRAIEASADLARHWGLALVLVHIVPEAPAMERWAEMLGDYHSRRTDRAYRELQLIAREIGGVQVTLMSTPGRPEDAIAEIASREPGGIIALGAQAKGAGRGRGPLQLGSTAYRLLCQTERPVLVFPAAAAHKKAAGETRPHATHSKTGAGV